MAAKGRILIVEDENIVAKDIQQRLELHGHEVVGSVKSGEEAIQKSADLHPDLVLMDIMLQGDVDGIAAAEQIQKTRDIPIVYLTAYTDESTLQRAKVTSPFGYVVKPFQDRELYGCIEMALSRHQMEIELRKNQAWLSAVLKSIGDAVVATDEKGQIAFMNPAAERLAECRLENEVGKKFDEVINIINGEPRKDTGADRSKVEKNGGSSSAHDCQHALVVKDHKSTPVENSVASITDENGNVLGTVRVFRDITERVRSGDALNKAHQALEIKFKELEQKNRETEEFIYAISHDLKNPLVSIQCFLSDLKKSLQKTAGERERFSLSRIDANVQKLESLIYDLIKLLRVGSRDTRLEVVNLNDIITGILQRVEDRIKVRRAVVSVQPGFPSLMANAHKIDQVLTNLISNATDYLGDRTDPKIDIGFHEKEDSWVLFVRDNGIGIPEAYHEKVFKIFERLPEAANIRPEGTGVGLAIVRKIIEQLGGRVWLTSSPGTGSTFYFTIPKREVSEPAAVIGKW